MNTAARPNAADNRAAPSWAIVALAAFVLLVLFSILAARLTGYRPDTPDLTPVVAERLLSFRDRADGTVLIIDADSGEQIESFSAGEGSFLRGIMRALVRMRRSAEVNSNMPFLLTRHSDGRLRISDPQTGESIDLGAFGPDNIVVFARLLPARPDASVDADLD